MTLANLRRISLLALLLSAPVIPLTGGLVPVAQAAPEPEAIPRRWELRVEPGPLRLMSVNVPGVGTRAYFYFTFKVTNNSGQDLYFAPSFDLALSDGTVARSGRDVPPEVTQSILKYINNPFLQDEVKTQGNLLQGPENAREGLVIWPATNLHVTDVTVYAAGFSGETKSIKRPDNGKNYVLRKSLMLRHDVSGDLDPSLNAALTRSVQRWILR